ncbi:similar to Saccharomyces cerevisiae YOL009C MDM12 Mitochondrial outer membrane protein, required for transmission of mitochondria to daughter cells [Maudiozyma barnettii]|uniref:Similar to Saccharomyces cerevisiae YOL009C MDM12 Mitochondrial outer membrane protein, required for transmission of mitochondria to daughter cells n=1 Tax=Maudiozyma barnettii TaxID=61262 RepID=A0A8H2VER3_9SACH|nr:ERMES complex subunit MDM12 [Kazachstania barnettii]CAB4254190.1 similar to Saccharomyces cerevisiae YOL009C MDM12 Mitochondrial outer membrane protein, required for transmission of mitochondria to daughter cells [Kazachstania barnettii]CAD1781924.1 similar to Saccharomyces cerevisiae YOL009C MDM12 Mitochondrial outer membrane protein, required for transmission of mitochondria to daughter cells [Kazachstania barnettii]
MSFEVHWEDLQNDVALNAQIRDKLNSFFGSLELPSYLNHISITDFQIGSHAPEIILHDISEPISGINPNPSGTDENDLQLLFEVKYDDDLQLELNTSLVLNYPSKEFMALPINIKVRFVSLHILCLIGIFNKGKRIVFSVLCDIEDQNDSTRRQSIGDLLKDKVGSPLERLAIIKDLSIETEIGSDASTNLSNDLQINDDDTLSELSYSSNPNGATLRNVDKLEQFLVEKLKNFLRQEVGWPSWLTFELDDESSDESDEDDSGNE